MTTIEVDRNEVVSCFAETRQTLTHHTGKHGTLLLIDLAQKCDTGWFGHDDLVNRLR